MPARCHAKKGNCPLGGDDSHFDNEAEAQAYADKVNEEKHGIVSFTTSSDTTDAQNLDSQEVEDQFYEEYYPHHDIGSSEMGYFKNLVDVNENSPVDQAFIANFGKDSLVTEIDSDNPMDYSLDSNDDGMYYSHEVLFYDVEKEGHDLSKVYADRENNEYTPEFRKAYGEYLKSNQGPTKEMFDKRYAKIPNVTSDEGVHNFVKTFIKNRS